MQRLVLFFLALGLTVSVVRADVVYEFNVAQTPYDSVSGDILPNDYLFGTATFANVGDTAPTNLTLSTTAGGGLFTLSLDETNAAASLPIQFVWNGSSIQNWLVNLQGTVPGFGVEATLGTNFGIPGVPFPSPSFSVYGGSNFGFYGSPGSWAAVPEPNSLLALLCSGAAVLARRRRIA